MDIQLEDGRIAQFPDDATEDEIKNYLDRNFPKAPKAPNVLERAAGHLSKGVATLAKDTSNLISYVDDSKSRTLSQIQEAFGDNKYTRQVEAYPETSLLGQAAAGIAEFAPQIPLFATGEGLGMAALKGLPITRKIPAVLEAVKGENIVKGTARAMGRGAIAGGVVGTLAGSDADTPIEEKLKMGAKEAVGFAGATAVFHPAFAGLGMAGRAIIRRLGRRATPERVEAELEKKAAKGYADAAEDLQKIKLAKVETPVVEMTEVKEEEDLYVPKGEEPKVQGELPLEPLPAETLQKFADLGYTEKDLEGLPDKELIKILDNGVKKPSVPSIEQPVVMTENLGRGIGKGEGQISIPSVAEKPFGKKITTEDLHRKSPDTIITLQRMGYQGSEIKKMTNAEARDTIEKVKNAPEPPPEVVAKAEALAAKVDEVAKARKLAKAPEALGKDRPVLSEERKKEIDAEIERELAEAEANPEPEPAIASLIGKIQERFLEDDTIDILLDEVPKSKEEIVLNWKLKVNKMLMDRALGIKREKIEKDNTDIVIGHGTGYNFDSFSDEKILNDTGMGEASYGYGHNFSASKAAYEWYASLTGNKTGNRYIYKIILPKNLNLIDLDKPLPKNQAEQIVNHIKKKYNDNYTLGMLADAINKDKTLGWNGASSYYTEDGIMSGDTVQSILRQAIGDKNASIFLSDAGIKGNTYIDDRFSYNPRNYTIFKAEDIPSKIKEESLSLIEKKPPQNRAELDVLLKNARARARKERKTVDTKALEEEWEQKLKESDMSEELSFDDESTLYSDPTGIGHLVNYISKKMKSKKIQEEAPSKTIVAELNGSKLYRSDDAHVDGLMSNIAKNIHRFAQMKLESPDFAFRNNEKIFPLIFNIHKKVYEGNFAASQRNEIVRNAETLLGKGDNKENIKSLLEGKTTEGTANEIEAARMVKSELDGMREKYKDHLREEYKKNLNEDEYAALSEIIAGKPIDEVIAKYKEHIVPDKLGRRRVRNWLNEEVVRDIAKDYAEIDSWGLDNYVTHVEKGHLRIVSEGKLYAKAMSEADAARKFADLVELHPNKNFRIETPSYEELATGLSKNAYNRVLFNLQEGLKKTIDGINSQSAYYLAQKGIKGRFFIKPTKEFSPYVLDRNEFLQGEKNVFEVLYGYMYSMERKMAIDPAIDDIRRAINRMDVVGTEAYKAKDGSIKKRAIKQSYLKQDEKEYLQRLVEDIKGRYYAVDKAVDSLFTGSGYSRVYSKAIQGARELEANLKLGYAPVKGIINGLSGLGHIWTKTGTKFIADGATFLRTAEGKDFIKAMEPYLGVNIVESASGELSSRGSLEKMLEKTGILGETGSMRRKMVHVAEPMGLFQAPEIPVRKLTLAANYLMAKDSGLSEAAARDAAIKANWFQQFTYDMASLPEIMRGPTGRLITQFKPYMLKEMEFISTLRGPEIARYIGMQLALAGPRGGIIVLKSLPVLGMLGVWDEIEEWMNKEYPVASRGIGGLAGVDVSAAATFQFPSTMKDWLGPTLSDIGSFYKNVVTPTIEKKGLDGADLSKFTSSTFPILRYYSRLIEQAIDKDGWVKDERGRRLYHIDNTAAFVAKSVMGAEPIELNRIRTEERILATRSMRITDQKTMTIDNILDNVAKGKPIDKSDIENMVKLGIKPGTLRRAAQFRVLDPKQRRLLQTELIRRPEILEMYPDAADLK